jgi:hypothetical protein
MLYNLELDAVTRSVAAGVSYVWLSGEEKVVRTACIIASVTCSDCVRDCCIIFRSIWIKIQGALERDVVYGDHNLLIVGPGEDVKNIASSCCIVRRCELENC